MCLNSALRLLGFSCVLLAKPYAFTTVDPGFADPASVDPGFVGPVFADPGFMDAASVAPGFVDPAFVDSGFLDSVLPDPGFVDPASVDPGVGPCICGPWLRVVNRRVCLRGGILPASLAPPPHPKPAWGPTENK